MAAETSGRESLFEGRSQGVEIKREDGDSADGFLRVWIDGENVFQDSPVALVVEMGGPPFGVDTEQTVTCGPVQFTLAPVEADVCFSLKLSEAETLRDGLTRLLDEARRA